MPLSAHTCAGALLAAAPVARRGSCGRGKVSRYSSLSWRPARRRAAAAAAGPDPELETERPPASSPTSGSEPRALEGTSSSGEPAAGPVLPQWVLDAVTSPLAYVTVGILVGVRVVGASDSVQTVVGLSALPVVGLSILARTPAGQQLQNSLVAGEPQREAARAAQTAARAAARAANSSYGPPRPLAPWLAAPPAHCDGTYAGDWGFDPLGLAADGRLARMVEAELLHARWAMLGVPGALIPELLSRAGVDVGESIWWKVGAAKLQGETINWGGLEGFRVAGGQGVAIIAACQLVLMGGPEYARYVGIKALEPVGVPLPGDTDYPGGIFDPFRLSEDAAYFEEQKVYEVWVGRLAMLAFLGLAAQAAATKDGPIANLAAAMGA